MKEFQINHQDFIFKPIHMTYCFSKKKKKTNIKVKTINKGMERLYRE